MRPRRASTVGSRHIATGYNSRYPRQVRSRLKLPVAVSLGLFVLAMSAPASAQIYTWTDGNGHLVLSNRPKGGAEQAYVVPKSEAIRATRPVDTAKSSLCIGGARLQAEGREGRRLREGAFRQPGLYPVYALVLSDESTRP